MKLKNNLGVTIEFEKAHAERLLQYSKVWEKAETKKKKSEIKVEAETGDPFEDLGLNEPEIGLE